MEKIHGFILEKKESTALMDLEKILEIQIPVVDDIIVEKEHLDVSGSLNKYKKEIPGIVIYENHVRKMCLMPFDELRGAKFPQKLPESMGDFSFLEELIITSYGTTELPESIGKLKSLTRLKLEQEKIKHLPNSLVDLSSLKYLKIKLHQLEKLPELFGNLNSLQILDLDYCQLKNLPHDIGNLENLETLNLQGNNLIDLPESFRNLQNLTYLNLNYNHFECIPIIVGELHSLQMLEFGNEDLKIIPDSLGFLKKLKILAIKHGKLDKIPDSIKNLIFLEDLEILYTLSYIPDFIGELKSLKKLFFSEILSQSLPDSIVELNLLQILIIKHGNLINLPKTIGKMTSLRYIDIADNNIEYLPESIGNLKSLTNLKFEKNKLTDIPRSIEMLENLQELWLNDNNLTKVPTFLWKLKNLKLLFISNNPLVSDWETVKSQKTKMILELCKKKEPINICITSSREDFQLYRINELAEFLDNQEEINEVFYQNEVNCENSDNEIKLKLQQSHIIIFFATENSIFNSNNPRIELKFAREHEIPVIPVLGVGLKWADLKTVELNRMLGIEFEEQNFNGFCVKLSQYVYDFKRSVDLFDREQGRIDKALLEIKFILNDIMSSEHYKNIFKSANHNLNRLKLELKEKKIEFIEFLVRFADILKNQITSN